MSADTYSSSWLLRLGKLVFSEVGLSIKVSKQCDKGDKINHKCPDHGSAVSTVNRKRDEAVNDNQHKLNLWR